MKKSLSYFNVILKDQNQDLSKLIKISQEENSSASEELSIKKKILIGNIKIREKQKQILWQAVKSTMESPRNRIERFQAAECKNLLSQQRQQAEKLAKISQEHIDQLKMGKIPKIFSPVV